MAAVYNPDSDKISYCSADFELVCITQVESSTVTLSVVGGYRSPNMVAIATCEFYAELRTIIANRLSKGDDAVVVAMDDNSSDKKGRAFKELEKLRIALHSVHVIQEPTHKGKQPDHALEFYDPLRFTVTGMVIPGVGDHDAMIVDVEAVGVYDIRPQWSNRRKIIIDHGDPGGKLSTLSTFSTTKLGFFEKVDDRLLCLPFYFLAPKAPKSRRSSTLSTFLYTNLRFCAAGPKR